MELIERSKYALKYRMEKDNYVAYITLNDIGDSLGDNDRKWYQPTPKCWKVWDISINDKNPDNSFQSLFLTEKTGETKRVLLRDSKGIIRVRDYNRDRDNNRSQTDMKQPVEGEINELNEQSVQDFIIVHTRDKETGDVSSTNYYYNKDTDKFVDETGKEVEDTILKNYSLVDKLVDYREDFENQFNDKMVNKNDWKHAPSKLDDTKNVVEDPEI